MHLQVFWNEEKFLKTVCDGKGKGSLEVCGAVMKYLKATKCSFRSCNQIILGGGFTWVKPTAVPAAI